MNQVFTDNIRLLIIERRKLSISCLEKKRDNINDKIQIQKEYLIAYQKTIPTVKYYNK